jgi:hypothetical protein
MWMGGEEARRDEAVFLLLFAFPGISPPKLETHGSHDYQEQSSMGAGLRLAFPFSGAGEDRTIKMEAYR